MLFNSTLAKYSWVQPRIFRVYSVILGDPSPFPAALQHLLLHISGCSRTFDLFESRLGHVPHTKQLYQVQYLCHDLGGLRGDLLGFNSTLVDMDLDLFH